jgi:hypothetical protein
MIDEKTKQKFIKELEKSGNVWFSCLKSGIHRSTYYRWIKEDKKFKKLAEKTINHGRENICDIAEHALMVNVKNQEMSAIKYVLGHLCPRYKNNRNRNVVILHKKEIIPGQSDQKTLEDIIQEADEDIKNAQAKWDKEHENKNKKNGLNHSTPIILDDDKK